MPKRFYAQRQHLVFSLDALLYQLHVVAFFLSPSVWELILRLISQFHCGRPKDVDLTHSLRFFYTIIFLTNLPLVWTHSIYGASEGRAVILDFVGMAYIPSKLQLVVHDITTILLQWILITLSYETALSAANSDSPDTLLEPDPSTTDLPLPSSLPTPITSRSTSPEPSSQLRKSLQRPTTPPPTNVPPEILDLRFSAVIARLRNPPPAVNPRSQSEGSFSLPLPITAGLPLPAGMRMLMRAQARRTAAATAPPPPTTTATGGSQRIPGSIDRD
ncbi:hypothetical protein BKA70DRAFT_1272902 [Coprinopsis sp. MPI-PUGE-AT-0042]|nr:hypothetical protein BKA70DRAFT_1272902 [Coprinopsis sp. MPI-PUGE-AT-0042]